MPSTCKLTQISFPELIARIRRRGSRAFGTPEVYAIDSGGTITFDPRPTKGLIKSIHIVINDERTLEQYGDLRETED